MEDCIFCKIAKKEIPKEFIYEDEHIMVFPDIHPIKPIHLLIIPKQHITDFLEVKDTIIFPSVAKVIQQMIRKENLSNKGYRVVVNGGGAQVVDHLHFHLTGPLGKAVQM